MRVTRRLAANALVGFAIGAVAVSQAAAQSAEEFYRTKKEMVMVVGSAPGGGYDGYARMLARYMSKYLPGQPNIITNNMPGAGGVRAANYVANIAPKDGSVISIMDRGLPTAPLLYGENSNTQFDPSKMNWLGSASSESGMAVYGAHSKAKTLADATKFEVVLGSTGAEGDTAMMPRMLNEMFGTKFKIITAYKGQPEVVQAVQKGELDGLFMSGWSGQTREQLLQMFARKEVGFMVQMGFKRDPAVGDVPTIMELIKNDDDRKVMEVILGRLELGRPFVAPPGVPADRVAVLRKAFSDACADPELVLEGDKTRRYIEPIDGATTQKMIEAVYATPPEVVAKIRTYVKPPAAAQ